VHPVKTTEVAGKAYQACQPTRFEMKSMEDSCEFSKERKTIAKVAERQLDEAFRAKSGSNSRASVGGKGLPEF
jgi:hypothetical protein